MSARKSFTLDEARRIGEQIGVDLGLGTVRCRTVSARDRRRTGAWPPRSLHKRDSRRPHNDGQDRVGAPERVP